MCILTDMIEYRTAQNFPGMYIKFYFHGFKFLQIFKESRIPRDLQLSENLVLCGIACNMLPYSAQLTHPPNYCTSIIKTFY